MMINKSLNVITVNHTNNVLNICMYIPLITIFKMLQLSVIFNLKLLIYIIYTDY